MNSQKKQRSLWSILEALASFKLASILFIFLFLLTWLGTLEQTRYGLYPTIEKYFSFESLYVIPEVNGRLVPLPLPGGYWVCTLLFFNILAGGVIRLRKNWKTFGVLLSHVGILLLLAGGMVTHHFSQRGMLTIWEGDRSNVARIPLHYAIEITELDESQQKAKKIHLIADEHLGDLHPSERRLFKMQNLPFDLEVSSYHKNSQARPVRAEKSSAQQITVDGFVLEEKLPEKQAEANVPGCLIRLIGKDGQQKSPPHILWATSLVYVEPAKLTVSWEDRSYLIDLGLSLWKLPFDVELSDFRAEFYPGTRSPKSFESDVIRHDDSGKKPTLIKMNEPLRYKGYTLFQTNYGPQEGRPEKMFSVFEVVKNPSDQWPLYALLISGTGLLIHFCLKLFSSLSSPSKKNKTGKEPTHV